MVQIAVAIGSNCEREHNVTAGLDALQNVFGKLRLSFVYESTAYSNDEDHPAYYNLIAIANSTLPATDIKAILRGIEDQCQRQRGSVHVTLDLDLLLYGDLAACVDGQDIPHPDIERHAYVLRPLMELMPDAVHPRCHKTYQALWREFPVSLDLTPVDFVWKEQLISTCAPFLSL